MSKVVLTQGKIGPNSISGYEKVSALVGYFGTTTGTSGTLALDTPKKFTSLLEAEGFGIASNKLLRHHVSEYFRMAGKNAVLYVLSLTSSVDFDAMMTNAKVQQLIIDTDKNIFQIGFSFVTTGVPTYLDGLHSKMLPAIKAAQVFADWCATKNGKLHVALECADYNGPAASAQDLRNILQVLVPVLCPQVSVMIGQDYDFAETLTLLDKKYAAVGTLLGCMAAQRVSNNVGEVATMSLTNAVKGLWVNAGLSNHTTVKASEAELVALNTKGYIFGEYYSGSVCLNDDHVCAKVIVDDDGNMNENSIALSRTNAKVYREIFKVYEPKLKSTPPVDKTTGLLSPGMIKYYEGFGNKVLSNMENSGEISGGITQVDPNSNLLFGDKDLKVFYNWVPMGTIVNISGTVNIRRSI